MNNSSVKPKVSVIVPVYKAEAYLHRCIDSLLAQTFTDFEVLLIDDGSPDRSGEICDEYAAKDARFRVFHKENGGVASARQMGIDNAFGEYVIHADPDDWVEATMLEELYNKAKEEVADMVICDFFTEKHSGTSYVSQEISDTNHHSVLNRLVAGTLHGSVWNKLIRTGLYNQFDVKFPLRMTYCEDLFVVCSLLLHDIKVSCLPKAFYHYDNTINENSLTSNIKPLSKDAVDSLIYYTDYFSDISIDDDYASAINTRKCYTKTIMWYSQYYPRRYFLNKYKEINGLITDNNNSGISGSRSISLAVSKIWGGYCLAKIIEKLKRFQR